MNCYFMKLSARVPCSCCKSRILVEVSDHIDAEEDSLYDVETQIKEAIETQQADDGWYGDYCPRCAKNNAERFAKEADADDFCSRDKSNDIY